MENGEDGIYNLLTNDKNVIFQPKVTITKKDLLSGNYYIEGNVTGIITVIKLS